MSINLSVNLNKIALVRNSRPHNSPDMIAFAETALSQGAAGITLHPRPDGRHVRPQDAINIGQLLRKNYPRAELNIEGNPFDRLFGDSGTSIMDFVCELCPHQFTAVPDSENQPTSDHGWQINEQNGPKLREMVRNMNQKKIRVSIFVDPDPNLIPEIAETGAQRVELYTEPYARAYLTNDRQKVLDQYINTAKTAVNYGLEINAGHDLDLINLGALTILPGLKEVSIGHALTVDALKTGFAKAVNEYLQILKA